MGKKEQSHKSSHRFIIHWSHQTKNDVDHVHLVAEYVLLISFKTRKKRSNKTKRNTLTRITKKNQLNLFVSESKENESWILLFVCSFICFFLSFFRFCVSPRLFSSFFCSLCSFIAKVQNKTKITKTATRRHYQRRFKTFSDETQTKHDTHTHTHIHTLTMPVTT